MLSKQWAKDQVVSEIYQDLRDAASRLYASLPESEQRIVAVEANRYGKRYGLSFGDALLQIYMISLKDHKDYALLCKSVLFYTEYDVLRKTTEAE